MFESTQEKLDKMMCKTSNRVEKHYVLKKESEQEGWVLHNSYESSKESIRALDILRRANPKFEFCYLHKVSYERIYS